MSLLEITDQEFAQQLNQSDRLVLAYFWAPWCGPCRLMSPSVKAIAEEYTDQLKVLKLAVDDNPETVAAYQVEGVPALRLFQDGHLVLAQEGAITRNKIIELLSDYLTQT